MSTTQPQTRNSLSDLAMSPPTWPDHAPEIKASDLAKHVNVYGNVRGYRNHEVSIPLKENSIIEFTGNAVYFANSICGAGLKKLLCTAQFEKWIDSHNSRNFLALVSESAKPWDDHYLKQVRLFTKYALRQMYYLTVRDAEWGNLPIPNMTVFDALWSFVEHESACYGTNPRLTGGGGNSLGVIGNNSERVSEELAFGYMTENEFYGVFRIWSYGRLVTK